MTTPNPHDGLHDQKVVTIGGGPGASGTPVEVAPIAPVTQAASPSKTTVTAGTVTQSKVVIAQGPIGATLVKELGTF